MKLWDWQALNRQGIAAVIVSAILMVWIYSSLEERAKVPTGPLGHTPDSFMTDFVRSDFDIQGQLHTRLRATQMDHFADDLSTELNDPILDVYKDRQEPWRIRANHAWVDVQQDVLILNGHVVLTRNKLDGTQDMQVNSESAILFPKTNDVEGDNAVTIDLPSVHITGVGFRANVQTRHAEVLHRVKSHYEINNKHS